MPREQKVRVLFIGEDRLTAQIKTLERRLRPLEGALTRPFRKARKAANLFWGVLKSMVAFRVVSSAMSGIERGVAAVTEEYISFDSAVSQAAAKFPGRVQRGTAAFEGLEEAARKVGASTQYTSAEAAEGLKFLAMAGFEAEAAMAALPVIVDLATASGEDFARVSDIATDALGAFSLTSKDAATQAENLTRISDVFSATVNSANVTLENMYNSMRDGAPIMTSAGQSVETFSALVGVMGNAGIKGSKAGTTLKNAFLRLQAPPKAAANMLAKYNINVADSQGNMRDFVDILADMENAFAGTTKVQRNAAMSVIFGRYAVAGMTKVFDQGSGAIKEYRSKLEAAGGTTKDVAGDIRQSLENRLKILKSSLIEAGFRVIDAFKKKFPNALDAAIEAIRNFDVSRIIKWLETTVELVKSAWRFWKEWGSSIKATIKTFLAFKAAFKIAGAFATAVDGVMRFRDALKTATLAQAALSAAAWLNPWFLIAAAILLVIGGLALLIYKWDDVQSWWVKGLKDMLKGTSEWVNTLAKLNGTLVQTFSDQWTEFKNHFIDIWNSIKQVFSGTMRFAVRTMQQIPFLSGLVEGVDADKIGVGQSAYEKKNKYAALAAGLHTNKQMKDLAKWQLDTFHGYGDSKRRAVTGLDTKSRVPEAAERGVGPLRGGGESVFDHNIYMEFSGLPEGTIENRVKTQTSPGSHIGKIDVRRAGKN